MASFSVGYIVTAVAAPRRRPRMGDLKLACLLVPDVPAVAVELDQVPTSFVGRFTKAGDQISLSCSGLTTVAPRCLPPASNIFPHVAISRIDELAEPAGAWG